MKRPVLLILPCLLSLCGCLSEEESTTLVSPNPFAGQTPAPPPNRVLKSATTPSVETAARVDTLGRKILACNQQIGMRPLFRVIGAPMPEIFHVGQGNLYVTDGLVNQCKSDGELAALLCHELGKMVAEREALSSASPERLPPISVPVGSDNAGSFGAADGTGLVELARFGKSPRGTPTNNGYAVSLPNPETLARKYLTKACFAPADYDAVMPLLQAAEKNTAWEKQMSTGPAAPARPWSQ